VSLTANEKNCKMCAYSFMEPDDDLTCGHPDAGTFGKYVARGPIESCGENRKLFELHLKRVDARTESERG
jgi:hypothetical protein